MDEVSVICGHTLTRKGGRFLCDGGPLYIAGTQHRFHYPTEFLRVDTAPVSGKPIWVFSDHTEEKWYYAPTMFASGRCRVHKRPQ